MRMIQSALFVLTVPCLALAGPTVTLRGSSARPARSPAPAPAYSPSPGYSPAPTPAYDRAPTYAPGAYAAPAPRTYASPAPSVSPLPAARPAPLKARITLVVDIDETLSITDYNSVLWGIGSDDSQPLAGSVETLRELSEHFDIVYLSARPDSTRDKSRRWLERHGFPAGEILGSSNVGQFIFQGSFKSDALERLCRQRRNVMIGIGDKVKDGEAYRENGLVSLIVNPWKGQRYHRNDVVCRDWYTIRNLFRKNHALLTDPARLAAAQRDGRLPMNLAESAATLPPVGADISVRPLY